MQTARVTRFLTAAAFLVAAWSSGAAHALNVGDKAPAFTQPLLKFGGLLGAGALFVVFATQFQFLQRWLQTTTLTTNQWGAVLGLALVMPLIVDASRDYVTLGEMCDALREVWGVWRETPVF